MTERNDCVRDSIFHEAFDSTREELLYFRNRATNALPKSFWDSLSQEKIRAVSQGNQLISKSVWCMETIGLIQDSFIASIVQIKDSDFEGAWHSLCECESQISRLDWHFRELKGEFGIEHIRTHSHQLRELYPLRFGISPGILIHEKRCSICNEKLSLRAGCTHELNEIYDGEMCHIVVSEFEPYHIAIVDNPAQKATYIWPEIQGNPNFDLIAQVCHALSSPWVVWSYSKEERRRYHPAFKKVGRNESCPCGSSIKYKRCCASKETVPDFPHFQIALYGNRQGGFT